MLDCLQQILLSIRPGGVSRHFLMTVTAQNIELSYSDSARGKPGPLKCPRRSGSPCSQGRKSQAAQPSWRLLVGETGRRRA